MFPGAHASIYRNEAGEVTGWDYPGEDDGIRDVSDADWDEYKDGNDEPECEGHESLNGAHMGETVYCRGACARRFDDLGEHHEREYPDGDPVTVR
jgi:hypothetical protein